MSLEQNPKWKRMPNRKKKIDKKILFIFKGYKKSYTAHIKVYCLIFDNFTNRSTVGALGLNEKIIQFIPVTIEAPYISTIQKVWHINLINNKNYRISTHVNEKLFCFSFVDY